MVVLYTGTNLFILGGTLILAQVFYNFLHYKNQRKLRKKCPYCHREI